MENIHIVFTYFDGKYYVEEVTKTDIERLKKQWYVAKIIDETQDYNKYLEVAEELSNPSIKNNQQFIVVQELSE
jgi:hypothetical protein